MIDRSECPVDGGARLGNRETLGQGRHGAKPDSNGRTAHHFTVDVEEYFQVSAFEPYIPRATWGSYESRVQRGVESLLGLLDDFGGGATFFVLGWVARRQRQVVQTIADAGHEVASHGWDHRRVTDQTASEFRESVRSSKRCLEDLTGTPVLGFRAPSFSIVPGQEWALDVLIEEGYRYDSSLFPVRRRGYGYPSGARDPHWLNRPAGRLAEIPPATLRIGGLNVPAAGGAYFRLLPYWLCQGALKDSERRGVPATFYIHPWEVDPEQPRVPVSLFTAVRHYTGLSATVSRLSRLLREFTFIPVARTVATLDGPP